MKIKRIFSMKLANELINEKFNLIRTTPDKIYKGRIVYIFELTNDLVNYLKNKK